MAFVKDKMITSTQFKINFDDYLFEANISYELEIRSDREWKFINYCIVASRYEK